MYKTFEYVCAIAAMTVAFYIMYKIYEHEQQEKEKEKIF
jgi:hypothetical protein